MIEKLIHKPKHVPGNGINVEKTFYTNEAKIRELVDAVNKLEERIDDLEIEELINKGYGRN